MAMTEIPNINYEIKGNLINIEQGEPANLVKLHRVHFDHIASELGLTTLSVTAQTIKRRFEKVSDELNSLAANEHYREHIIKYCSKAFEYLAEFDAIRALANEFLNDINDSTFDEQGAAL